jgi:hypothetical protein
MLYMIWELHFQILLTCVSAVMGMKQIHGDNVTNYEKICTVDSWST